MTNTVELDFSPATGHVPPQDIAAEAAVLGSMLYTPAAVADVIDLLTVADFYRINHGLIYQAILDQYSRGEPSDAVTIAAALNDQNLLTRVGGAPYLHTLIAKVPNPASVTYYAGLVRRAAEDRSIIDAGHAIAAIGSSPLHDPDNPKADQASSILYAAIQTRTKGTLTPIGESLGGTLAAIEAGRQEGISTGYPDLDDITRGLHKGQLWYIAARPAVGKSTAVMDIARAVVKQHMRVLYFSLEMSTDELLMRVLSAESGVPLEALQQGGTYVDDAAWEKLADASERIAGAPMLVDETPALSIVDIAARARREAATGSLGLIVIDHVHLVASSGGKSNDNRQVELSRISAAAKVLAKELHTTVLCAAQLNRGNEQRVDKRPVMSDMRDSGSLEQDADVVILLHRDDYYDPEAPNAGEADFIVAKHRGGRTGTVTLASQLHVARFVSMAR